MFVTVQYYFTLLFFLIILNPSISESNGHLSENDIQNIYNNRAKSDHHEAGVPSTDNIMKTNSKLYLKCSGNKGIEDSNSKYGSSNQYTLYDIIFIGYFTVYVLFVIYIRVKTHFRVDYKDGNWSLLSLVTTYRKASAPDGTIDPDLRKSQNSKLYDNTFLIALAILFFGLSLCNYDEIFSDPRKHIEDVYGLLSAMIRYFFYILGVCYIFDVCLAPPYCYYT